MLKEFTIEELQKEIDRKKAAVTQLPTPAAEIDFTALKLKVLEYAEDVAAGGMSDVSFQPAIFQLAVEAVYPEDNGEAIWEWIRTRREKKPVTTPAEPAVEAAS